MGSTTLKVIVGKEIRGSRHFQWIDMQQALSDLRAAVIGGLPVNGIFPVCWPPHENRDWEHYEWWEDEVEGKNYRFANVDITLAGEYKFREKTQYYLQDNKDGGVVYIVDLIIPFEGFHPLIPIK